MPIDPRRLRVLLAVVRAGGVVGAAEALRLTPQALSQQIALLEHEVGVRLFDRSRRRLAPTAAGKVLAGHAERVEAELVSAARALSTLTGRAAGVVKIAAFQSAIRWLVVEALPAVRAEQPGVTPMVIELHGRVAERALRAGRVDLVIDERDEGDAPPAGAGLAVTPLRSDPYFVVASAPAARALRGRSLRALAEQRWVAAPAGSACRSALDRLAARACFEPRVSHVCLEFPTVLALVGAGEGVAIVPELALTEAGPFERCAFGGLGVRRLLALQRTSRRGTEPAADAVVQALLAGDSRAA